MFLEKIKSIYCGYTENHAQYIVYFGLCTTNPDYEIHRSAEEAGEGERTAGGFRMRMQYLPLSGSL